MTRHGIGTTPNITNEKGEVVMKGGSPRIEDGAEVGGGHQGEPASVHGAPASGATADLSRRVELCQCPGCGREIQLGAKMADMGSVFVIVLRKKVSLTPKEGLCPVCGLKPGEPDA